MPTTVTLTSSGTWTSAKNIILGDATRPVTAIAQAGGGGGGTPAAGKPGGGAGEQQTKNLSSIIAANTTYSVTVGAAVALHVNGNDTLFGDGTNLYAFAGGRGGTTASVVGPGGSAGIGDSGINGQDGSPGVLTAGGNGGNAPGTSNTGGAGGAAAVVGGNGTNGGGGGGGGTGANSGGGGAGWLSITYNVRIYVADGGNDSTGDGTATNPYAKVSKALSVAADMDIVDTTGLTTSDEGDTRLDFSLGGSATVSIVGTSSTTIKSSYSNVDNTHHTTFSPGKTNWSCSGGINWVSTANVGASAGASVYAIPIGRQSQDAQCTGAVINGGSVTGDTDGIWFYSSSSVLDMTFTNFAANTKFDTVRATGLTAGTLTLNNPTLTATGPTTTPDTGLCRGVSIGGSTNVTVNGGSITVSGAGSISDSGDPNYPGGSYGLHTDSSSTGKITVTAAPTLNVTNVGGVAYDIRSEASEIDCQATPLRSDSGSLKVSIPTPGTVRFRAAANVTLSSNSNGTIIADGAVVTLHNPPAGLTQTTANGGSFVVVAAAAGGSSLGIGLGLGL